MTYPNSGSALPMGTPTTDQAAGSAHAFVDRLAQGAHDTVEKVATRSGRVTESMRSMQDNLRSQAQQLVDSRGELVESARGYVRERPFTALLAAALVGVLVAGLMRGR